MTPIHRLRGGRSVRSARGRAALCLRLSAAGQRYVRRPNHRQRTPTILRPDRPCSARRGNELPLSSTGDLCRSARHDASGTCRGGHVGLSGIAVHRGATWTTDAPSKPKPRLHLQGSWGALAVEMEAAALYALATAKSRSVICLAHVTNAMAQTYGDFEKGEANGTKATLAVIAAVARVWLSSLKAEQHDGGANRI
jgi:hypothetical protein